MGRIRRGPYYLVRDERWAIRMWPVCHLRRTPRKTKKPFVLAKGFAVQRTQVTRGYESSMLAGLSGLARLRTLLWRLPPAT